MIAALLVAHAYQPLHRFTSIPALAQVYERRAPRATWRGARARPLSFVPRRAQVGIQTYESMENNYTLEVIDTIVLYIFTAEV